MVSGDFNGDGRSDVATFYDDSPGARIHVWLSSGGSFSYRSSRGWWRTGGRYRLRQVADRMVAGDYNGDGRDDIAVFYDSGAGARIHVFLSTGGSFAYQGDGGWWGVDSGYSLEKVGDRMTAGDFNRDGRDDIAVFYDYPGSAARIHVWLSTGRSFSYKGNRGWWRVDRGYTLSRVGGRMVSGDFNGDGRSDIATFYDDSPGARIHVWLSSGGSFSYRSSRGWWRTEGRYRLRQVADRMVAGDYNGDERDDIAVFYDSGAGARTHVFLSTGGSFTYQGDGGWWGVDSGYALEKVGDRMVSGRFGP